MDATQELLKILTEAQGVPGYEAPVRAEVRNNLERLGEVFQEIIGNLMCRKSESAEAPKVMLAGQMDEIGFMDIHITEEGFIKLLALGGCCVG